MSNPVRVMVTIDTEEDDWGTYRPRESSVANIQLLPELAELWGRFGVRPTYLVNYPPMASAEASGVLKSVVREGRCEFGVQCHPWNTPPLRECQGRPPTMMSQLSEEENHAKLTVLTGIFQETFGFRPRSFRAGRWGLGPSVARPLSQLGYEVDLSVAPFMDWTRSGGPDYIRALRHPYRFEPSDPFVPAQDGRMVEIPTSVGFLLGPQRLSAAVRRTLERSPLARAKVLGLLDSLGICARRWISPETSSQGEMIRVARVLVRSGLRVLDLTFHSSSLLPGANPFVRSRGEKQRLLIRTERFLEFCSRKGYLFSTASEVAEEVRVGTLS